MARLARSVEDVILGEAVSGTPEQRYQDMLGIASVIANRSAQLGVSPEKVVGVKSQFNAYGKSLPSGAEGYRDLARQALAQVQTSGPIHSATFFATPKASSNLPRGLEKIDKTTGHVYYSDPQNRAIKTADGLRSPRQTDTIMDRMAGFVPTAPISGALGAIDKMLNPPAAAPVGEYTSPMGVLGDRVTSDFGARSAPKTPFGIGSSMHPGVDMSLEPGASGYPVEATAGGMVTYAGPKSGYGNLVEVTHPDGYVSRYGHLGEIGDIAIGDEIARGTPVGLVGSTGNSTAPHLHFEIRDPQGRPVDPSTVVSFNPEARVPTPETNPNAPQQQPAETPPDDAVMALNGIAPPGAVERRDLPPPSSMTSFAPEEQQRATPISAPGPSFAEGASQKTDRIGAIPNADMPMADQYASYNAGSVGMRDAALLNLDVMEAQGKIPMQPPSPQNPADRDLAMIAAKEKIKADLDAQKQQMIAAKTAPAQLPPLGPPRTIDPMTVAGVQPAPNRAQQAVEGTSASRQAAKGPQQNTMERMFDSVFNTKTGGALAGALLGSALLGPVGGIIGGALGGKIGDKYLGDRKPSETPLQAIANMMHGRPSPGYFPDAPARTGSSVGTSFGDLNDRGRATYSSSGQFKDAIDSGKPGLF